MVMPSGPKRAVTIAPLLSARHLKFRSRTLAAASTIAQVMRASSAVGFGLATASRVSPVSLKANIKTRPACDPLSPSPLHFWRRKVFAPER